MKAATQEDYQRRILKAQEFISQQLDCKLLPIDVAKESGFSLHHFHRIFKGLVGESMMEFSRRLRLERSARQLVDTQRSIVDIALAANYNSHEAFTRAFKNSFGQSPSSYRTEPKLKSLTSILGAIKSTLEVEMRKEQAMQVLFMQHTGSYLQVSQVWEKLIGWIAANKIEVAANDQGIPTMYGLVPDDPEVTPTEYLRYKACCVLKSKAGQPARDLPGGPVARTAIPQGLYAVAIHKGAYETLHETYLDLIGRWFPQSGYIPSHSPVVEHYLNSPHNTEPSELRTELRVQVRENGWY